MTLPDVVLETAVENSRAVLAAPPDLWSYSSLNEVGQCPRQFALTRARYPGLWDRPRYPTLPTLAALFGNVVHGALEVVVKALVDAGVASVRDIQATEALRELGGLSSVVDDQTTTLLAPLEQNPRLTPDRRRRLARDLRARAPEARVQVQMFLSRTAFTPALVPARKAARAPAANTTTQRSALQEGSHPEVQLIADDLRLIGRIDLLTIARQSVTIVDYKSGAEAPGHQEQLRLYALLWDRDSAANPDHRAVDRLVVAYREMDSVVATPSATELAEMARDYAARVGAADAALRSGEPEARPREDVCRFCAVRQLCSAYWKQMVPPVTTLVEGAWFDYEGVVGSRNGARSWWLMNPDSGQREILLRTPDQTPPFDEGNRIRVLGLRRESDPELAEPIATLVSSAEVFRLAI